MLNHVLQAGHCPAFVYLLFDSAHFIFSCWFQELQEKCAPGFPHWFIINVNRSAHGRYNNNIDDSLRYMCS